MKIIIFVVTLGLVAFVTTVIFYNTQQADINYYQGYRYFRKGQYDKAIISYKRIYGKDSRGVGKAGLM